MIHFVRCCDGSGRPRHHPAGPLRFHRNHDRYHNPDEYCKVAAVVTSNMTIVVVTAMPSLGVFVLWW